MKVMIAVDSFKGSLSSTCASKSIEKGVKQVYPDAEILSFILADGGEGTIDSIIQSLDGTIKLVTVKGPLSKPTEAKYGIIDNGKTAVIEISEACGIELLSKNELNPLKTTSYGVGEIIIDAMENGCDNFIIGLGGSSTNDGGLGMLQALGYKFLDNENVEVGFGGEQLRHIKKIKTDQVHSLLENCTFQIACDVNNKLLGKDGATHIFGPQKGASSEVLYMLESGMINFSEVIKRQLNFNVNSITGGGAAGGLGAAFSVFLNAELVSGIELVLNAINIRKYLKDVDYIITGEGKLDVQTIMGKAPSGIAKVAKEFNIPVIALAGYVEEDSEVLNENGIDVYLSILNKPMITEEAMDAGRTSENLRVTVNQLFRLIKVASSK